MRTLTHMIDGGAGPRTLHGYIPHATARSYYRGRRPAVIIFPGGGYSGTYEGEAEPIALEFAAAGVCAFVLDYSCKTRSAAVWPYAQIEAFAAIRFVRENAAEFGIDPANIATLGFSAGGHLCGCTGTLWNKPVMAEHLGEAARASRPDKMILCYPVIRAFPPCNRGSFVNLLTAAGLENDEAMLTAVSLEQQVDAETPPSFIWATAEDKGVPIQGALEFAHALADQRIHCEMHIWPHGPHGLCLGNHVTQAVPFEEPLACAPWIKDAIRFLYDDALTSATY